MASLARRERSTGGASFGVESNQLSERMKPTAAGTDIGGEVKEYLVTKAQGDEVVL